MTDTAWVHNLDPFLLQISDSIGLRWYGLAYITGFLLGVLFVNRLSKKKLTPLSVEQASDLLTYIIVGVLAGGRLGYALFYSPSLLTDFRSDAPYWGLLAVWEGGMASHGGFIGVCLACFYFAWKNKIDFFHLGDLSIVGASIGIGLGRIANFINGELMGRTCPPDFPLAVKFPQDIHRWVGYETEKLALLEEPAKLLGVSSMDWSRWIQNIPRNRSHFYQLADQIVEAIQSGNGAMVEAVRPILDPRHPSQLYASFTEAWIPLAVLLFIWRKPQKPGVISSLFLMMYSIGRIFNEQFRLPDAHIANLAEQPLGISRGQFISLWMFLAGVFFLIWSLKRNSKPLGGWATVPTPEKKKRSRK